MSSIAFPPDAALRREARETTRRVARTFALACRLLPRDVRVDVELLYLVFRTLDDVVDERRPEAVEAVAAVERWCASGAVDSREAALLADLDTRHPLPRASVAAFCAGMRDDLAGAPFETEDEVDLYCYRVAGTVGEVMASVLRVKRASALREAAALGMAMQRTNILRDIDEDLANGRVYLARQTLRRLGPAAPGRREALLREQIARADTLYDEGMRGIDALVRGRRGVRAAAVLYREILRQIEREGYGAQAGRAVVPRSRKLVLAARAGVR